MDPKALQAYRNPLFQTSGLSSSEQLMDTSADDANPLQESTGGWMLVHTVSPIYVREEQLEGEEQEQEED